MDPPNECLQAACCSVVYRLALVEHPCRARLEDEVERDCVEAGLACAGRDDVEERGRVVGGITKNELDHFPMVAPKLPARTARAGAAREPSVSRPATKWTDPDTGRTARAGELLSLAAERTT